MSTKKIRKIYNNANWHTKIANNYLHSPLLYGLFCRETVTAERQWLTDYFILSVLVWPNLESINLNACRINLYKAQSNEAIWVKCRLPSRVKMSCAKDDQEQWRYSIDVSVGHKRTFTHIKNANFLCELFLLILNRLSHQKKKATGVSDHPTDDR